MNRLQRCLVWLLACLMAQPNQISLAQAIDFPVVVERIINNGDPQRSTVTNVSLRFSSNVSVTAADLQFRNLNTGLHLDPTNFVATYIPGTNRATWTFPGLPGSSLPDGNYLATLRAAGVTNATGQPLDGNGDGLPGDGYSFGLFRSFGDFDGDRDVDFHDNDWFRRTWLKSAGDSLFDPRFDANGDGKIDAFDLALFQTNYFTVLAPQPGIFAELANDTGISRIDLLTSDPTIAGAVIQTNLVAGFVARLDDTNGAFVDVRIDLQTNATFRFDSNRLARIKGGPLGDGPHPIYLRTLDAQNNVSSDFVLPLILDTTPPLLTLELDPIFDSAPSGDFTTTNEIVTFAGQTEANLQVTLGPSGETTLADPQGQFSFGNVPLNPGTNSFTASATDLAGNRGSVKRTVIRGESVACLFDANLTGWTIQEHGGSPTGQGKVTANDCEAVITEGDSFLVSLEKTFAIPTGAGLLWITYAAPSFDTTATNLMRDDFEAALVDVSGRPLTFTIQGAAGVAPASAPAPAILPASPDAFFNHTEGHASFIAPGAALKSAIANPQFQTLAVDISQLGAGSTAKLILRLVNNDLDHGTTVRIIDVRFEASDPTLNLGGSPATALTLLSRSAIASVSASALAGDCAPNLPRASSGAPKVVLGAAGSPTLAVETPADNSHVAPGAALLTGDALANHSEIFPGAPATNRVVMVAVNGQPVDALDAAGNFYSAVGIHPGQNIFEVTATDAFEQTTTNIITVIGTTCPDNFSSLGVVSASVEPEYGRTSFREQTRSLYADLALRNTGTFGMRAPFYVGVTRITDPTVRLLAADGSSADGIPYYDFSSTMTNSALDPGQTSLGRTLAFHNPNQVQFSYELVVLGQLNQAPSFNSVPLLEAIIGRTYTYAFSVSDPDGDTLSFTLAASPTNFSLNSQLKSLDWLPATTDIGNHDIRLRAEDGRGGTAEQHYLLSVVPAPSNRPPHFVSAPVSVAHISTNTLSEPRFVDLSRWSVVQFQTNSPDQGAAVWVIDPSNTSATQQRNADASILLSDFPLANDEISGIWRAAPDADNDYMGFVFGYQDRSHFYLFDWKQGSQNDACGRALTGMNVKVISADTELICQDLWPSVITNDRVRTIFHNSILWEDGRDYAFTLQFASGNFAIQIQDGTNILESIQLTDATYASGSFGFYNYSQGNISYRGFTQQRLADATYAYDSDATDADGDTLTYSLTAAPNGMSVDPRLGLIRWGPATEQIGTHTVSVQVTDGRGGSATQSYVVCVLDPLENHARTNSAPVITTTPPSSAVAGLPYRYVIRAQDAEGQPLNFIATNAPAGVAIRTINAGGPDAGIASFDWISTLAQLGTSPVTIVVRDSAGAETKQTFDVDVVASAPNRPPGFVSRPRTQTRLTIPYIYLVEASDPDGDPLTIELISGPPGFVLTNAEPNVPNSQLVIWTPSAAQAGTNLVELRVNDGRGGTATQPFAINVRTTFENESPVIVSHPPLHATAGLPYEYNLAASDPDDDPVTYRLLDGPLGLSLDAQSGALRWVATLDQLGTNSVTVEVQDILLATAAQTWSIEVGCLNRPPQITSTPPVETSTDSPYLYALRATDPDGDSMTFDFANTNEVPVGMTLSNLTTTASGSPSPGGALVTWTPATNQVGPHVIRVRVSDNRGGTDTQTYTLYVGNIRANKAPVVVTAPSRGAPIGLPFTYTFRATDADGDTLAIQSLLPLPAGANFAATSSSAGQAEGILAWTPTAGGSQDFILTARDPSGASASQRFTVTVRANAPPQITSSPRTNATPDATYLYDVGAFDSDGDSLAYRLTGPAGMFLNSFGQITWTPNQSQLGNHPVTVTVTDDFGSTAAQSFAVMVGADTEPPSVELALLQGLINPDNGQWAGDLGTKVVVQVKSTDNVGIASQSLHLGTTELPLGGNGIASISVDRGGVFILTGVATDRAGNTNSATRSILFRDPRAESGIVVRIHTPTNDAVLTKPVPILATITNETDLVSYAWGYAPAAEIDPTGVSIADPAFTIVGTTNLAPGTRSLQNIVIGTFDPTLLNNDSYVLAVAATDSNGNTRTEPILVGVEGNLKFGEFRLEFTDLAIPVAGMPIQIKRVYDSRLARRSGDFGFGWSLGVQDAFIRESVPAGAALHPNSRVYLTGPDGKRLGFTFTPTVHSASLLGALFRPKFQPDPGVYDRLEVTDEIFSFAGAGVVGGILEALDPYNPSTYSLTTRDGTRYEYSESRGLQTVTDLNGNRLVYTADGIFHYSAESTTNDQSVSFVRDALGRISQIIAPDGKTWNYEYDAAGDLVRLTHPGNIVALLRYSANRLHFLETIDDPMHGPTQRTEYDEHGRVTAIIDAAGNRSEQTSDAGSFTGTYTDARGNVTQLAYDARGNLTRRQDTLGGVTTWEYTNPNYPDLETAIIDPRGNRTSFTYDERGNLLQEIHSGAAKRTTYTYNENNRITSKAYETGGREDFEYDSQNNLTHYHSTLGEWTLTYTAGGQPASVLDGEGSLTRFEYEGALSRPSRILSADGSTTQFLYDTYGHLTQYTDQIGHVTRFEYDSTGRLVRQIDPRGGVTRIAYDVLFPQQPSAVTNRAGRVTRYTYDALGRVQEVTAAGGAITRYEYDAEGNLTSVVDAVSNRTEFAYDKMNRLVEETDPLGKKRIHSYDLAGNRTNSVDRNSRKRSFVYDALNRATEERWHNPDDSVLRTMTFGYDPLDRLTSATDPDANVRPSWSSVPGGPQLDERASYSGLPERRITYTYDAVRRRIQMNAGTDAQNAISLRYDRDMVGRLRVLTSSALLPPSGVTNNAWQLQLERNARGDVTELHRFADQNGTLRVSQTFFTNSEACACEINAITHVIRTNQSLPDAAMTFTRDLEGAIIGLLEGTNNLAYGYDAAAQLTGVIRNGAAFENYAYDANGNRTASHLHASYVTGPANRLGQAGAWALFYDDEGNLVTKSNRLSSDVFKFTWDYRNRLTQVMKTNSTLLSASESTDYRYDSLNRRIVVIRSGQTNWTYYDGVQPLMDYVNNETLPESLFFNGQGTDELLGVWHRGEGTFWTLTDHLGSVRRVLDQTGTEVAALQYDSYGNILSATGTQPDSAGRFGFTGREWDADTELYYYRARYYDPDLGRFLSEDPLGFFGNDSNLYRYVGNSPVVSKDPTGLVEASENGLLSSIQRLAQPALCGALGAAAGAIVTAALENFGVPTTFAQMAGAGTAAGAAVACIKVKFAKPPVPQKRTIGTDDVVKLRELFERGELSPQEYARFWAYRLAVMKKLMELQQSASQLPPVPPGEADSGNF